MQFNTVKQKTKSPRAKSAVISHQLTFTLRVRYHTNVGQSLFVTGNHALLGNGDLDKAVPLQYLNEDFWQTTVMLPSGAVSNAPITYNYFVREANGSVTQDWGADKTINPAAFSQAEVLIIDSWNFAGFF